MATGKSVLEQDDSTWMYGDTVPQELRPMYETSPVEPLSKVEAINDRFQEMAGHAKIGSWYEFKQDDASPRRFKLTWRSSLTDLCVFVNRQGVKAAEMHVTEFAQGLRKEEIRLVGEAGPPMLVDRAMNAMVEALKRGNSESSEDTEA